MAMLKCKMCGGDLNLVEGASTAECEYCGSVQTIPKVDDEKKMNLFVRANRLRAACEFDKAAGVYETIVADFPEEAEAYWGLVLCKYGIEYVDDPATGKKVPTCHRSGFDSVMKDPNVELAQEYADVMARKLYREEAKAIEELRQSIISVSANEEPYDVFICYKETDFNGKRTLDSVLALDIYKALTDEGYRVFFSRISLEDKLGVEYEPYIFAALNSAKIMLVVGTDYEYFNAVWVKNEWSRFLKLMAKDKTKHLIPCYKGIDAYDMPEEFARLQAQDLDKMGAVQDIVHGVQKLLPKQEKVVKETVVVQQVAANNNPTVESYLKRAFMFLQDGDWKSADEYCEKVLDIDPECAEAYVGKLMAEFQVRKREDLKNQRQPFDGENLYQKAMRFGDNKLKAELQGYIASIKDSNLTHSYNVAMQTMRSATSEYEYEKAAGQFADLKDYKDSKAKKKECLEKAEKCRELAEIAYKDDLLSFGKEKIDNEQYDAAIQAFESIPGWKDADKQLEICRKKKAEKEAADEEQRLKEEQEAKAKAKRKERRTIVTLISIVLAGLIGYFGVYPYIAYQQGNYKVYIDMYNVKEFTIPEGVTEIKAHAFSDCESLKSVTIPDSVTSIGFKAFFWCDPLTEVTIGDSVTTIGEHAFGQCESLTSVTIPDSVTTIGESAFSGCDALTSVTIGAGVTSIGEGAFSECDSLTSVTHNEAVIESGCFSDCTNLQTVVIGDGVTAIEEDAFRHSFESVYITDLAAWCAIEFGDNPLAFVDNLYVDGELVTDLVIPDGVTSIENRAFEYCDVIKSVTIPDSVTSIGAYAFYNCDSLKDVYFKGTKSQWEALRVKLPLSATVHCTDGTIEDA
ncbi:MAG: leucine-rich repeat protein [Clostridia bacterium]|nr:leucine-rich repeat protein [Clostridia bacterium]